jgi:acetylserotonin N-methyltransferase
MFAAVQFGIFDKLHSEGYGTARALAIDLGLNEDALTRLLDACVGLKLLRFEPGTKDKPAVYKNTPVAATYLCKSSSYQMNGYIECSNQVFWPLWGKLEGAIREGTYRYQEALQKPGPEAYADLFASEAFLMGMHGYGQITSPILVDAFDLKGFRTLVDLGGGTGHVAIAACKRYQHLTAKVVELPAAAALARKIIAKEGLESRIEVLECNFFHDELPEGDLYCLARILHDWPEDKVLWLLKRVFDRLPPEGALIIAEKILDEDKSGPYWAQMQHLNMLAIAQGRERTLGEYTELLLKKTGFEDLSEAVTDSPLDFIIATKPGGGSNAEDLIKMSKPIEVLAAPDPENEKARAALVRELNLTELFFEEASVGFVVADTSGRFIHVNKAFAEIVGYTVKEVLQRNYKNFTPDEYTEEDDIQMNTILGGGQLSPFEKQYLHRNGHYVTVLVTLKLIKPKGHTLIWSLVQQLRDPSGIASLGGRVLRTRSIK